MLTPYRRHREKCKHRSRRYKGCSCPIWIQGTLNGEEVRRSLDLTNWEAAQHRIRELEIYGAGRVISVSDACARFMDDVRSNGTGDAQTSKYRLLTDELAARFGSVTLRSLTPDDVRKFRESWKLAPVSSSKKLERLRTFFRFCVDNGWCAENPAKKIKVKGIQIRPTLPFSESDFKDIFTALDIYGTIHSHTQKEAINQMRALILLMRYSGLRISDAVGLSHDRIDRKGRLFLYQAKTNEPVFVPLPKSVIDVLQSCGGRYYFWTGNGKLKSQITIWQERLKRLFVIAGIPDGHSHRFRDSFAVELLNKGVSMENVSILLGHKNISVTQRHYAPWVKSRQETLDEAVAAIWK